MNQKMAIIVYEYTLMISRIAMLNILWLIFVLLGAGIFGFLPATVTIYSVYRKQNDHSGEFNWFFFAWKQFWFYLKKLFLVSFGFTFICLSLFLSYVTLGSQSILFNRIIVVIFIYVFFLVVPYFSVNEAHFDLKLMKQIKNSVLLPFFWGVTSIKVLLVFFATSILFYLVPGLIPFFAFSLPVYLTANMLVERWNKQLDTLGITGGENDD